MQHFFVTPMQVEKPYIYLEGSDVNHMKNVLRMKKGEKVEISDGNNRKYVCAVECYEEGKAVLTILEEKELDTELNARICLFQGLPKADKMELVIQKAVELGAAEIIPVITKRSVVKLDAKKGEKKVQRWNEIAKSAAKQAGRGVIPQVSRIVSYQEALEYAAALDVILFPYELAEEIAHSREVISSVKQGQSVGVFIGPEGGFEKEEADLADKKGAATITLGRRILRTETAAITVLSLLMYHLES